MRHIKESLCLLVVPLILTTACTGGGDDSPDDRESNARQGSDLEAPPKSALATGVKLGDQTDQHLYGVAANESAIVAVGTDSSDNQQRPLILNSTDGGDSWTRSTIDGESVERTAGDSWIFEVAAGPELFVASGSDWSGHIKIWTSPNGESWTLAETGSSFRAQEGSSAITYAEGQFWMVGSNGAAAGKATSRIMLWTSSNGAAWRRHDLSRDLHGITGSPSAADVAVRGKTVLIAGGIEDNALTDQPNRLAIWRSNDAGKTFAGDQTPPDLGGGFRAYATDLVVHDGDFYMAVNGDGGSEERFGDPTWDSVVLRESGPRNWQKIAPSAFSTNFDDLGAHLFPRSDGWVVTGGQDSDEGWDSVISTGRGVAELMPQRAPSLRGPGDQLITDGVIDHAQVLLVGGTERTGSDEAAIWRLRGGEVTALELPDDAQGGEPSLGIGALVQTEEGFLISGHSAGSPVVWSSKDFETWSPAGLPGRTPESTSVFATEATVLSDQTPLLLGWRTRGNGSDTMAWREVDDDAWDDAVPTAFINRGEDGYGTIQVADVATRGKTTVIAANSYMNGQDEAHPVVSVSGGRTWSAGIGQQRRDPALVSDYLATTPWSEFAAPVNGSVSMNAVTATSDGWLIGGRMSAADQRGKPVVWRSREGRRWSGSSALPLPKAAWSASITSLVTHDKTVVAIGSLERQKGDDAATG